MVPKPTTAKDGDVLIIGLVPAKLSEVLDENDISAIEEAVFHANMNLYYRYGIWIESYETTIGTHLIKIAVRKSSDDKIGSIGQHLSGIARYIKKNYPNVYEKFKVGTRLFHYVEM